MKTTVELPITELKHALTGLSKTLCKRPALPVLGHLRCTRTSEGLVTLQTTDLDSIAVYRADSVQPAEAVDFLVPFEPLLKLVKGGKHPVQLTPEGQSKIRLTTFVGASPLEQVFETPPVDEYPVTPALQGQTIPVDVIFRDCLRQGLECCGEDPTRHILHHVCVDTSHRDGHYLAATDGKHLYSANSFQFDLAEPVLIPDRAFLRWNKFLEQGTGELRYQPEQKGKEPWVQLQSGPWTLITRTCSDRFPQWKQVVPAADSWRTRVQLNEEAAVLLLSGVPQLPVGDNNQSITLEVQPDRLLVKARAKDSSQWTQLQVQNVQITGKPVNISLNRQFLLKALRFGLSTVDLQDDLSPLVFSHGGRRLVVMPVRPPEAAVAASPTPTSSTPSPTPPTAEPPQAITPESPMTKPAATTEPATAVVESPIRQALLKVETIKDTLRGVLREFGDLNDLLRQVEKNHKASEKEVELVREKLR